LHIFYFKLAKISISLRVSKRCFLIFEAKILGLFGYVIPAIHSIFFYKKGCHSCQGYLRNHLYICSLKIKQMKKIKLMAFLGFVISLTSCSITEKMIIKEDGTGKFSYEIDGSKMMSMMGSAMKDEGSSKKKKKTNKDSVAKKVIDSTFTFKELYADKQDSIAKLPLAEQEKIKKMEKFSMHMLMDEEKGIMNYTMFTDFASVKELQDVMSPVETMKNVSPAGKQAGGMGMASDELQDNSSTSFFYDGKKFRKIVSLKEKVKEEVLDNEEATEEDELATSMKESLDMFYTQSNFRVVYEFPKAVKKVSIDNALYSEDRKTITIEYPLKDYMENPASLNFEVEFQ
jgi:hypothetical protein